MRTKELRPKLCPFFFLAIGLSGCAKSPPTMAHYQPVSHWIDVLQGSDAADKQQAVRILGNVGPADPRAIVALAAAVGDADVAVRREAILALLKLGPPAKAAAPALRKAQSDSDATVRAYAARALQRVEPGK
jgi:HEAT repeat protein